MNEKEYRELIDELGLSQISIAEILESARHGVRPSSRREIDKRFSIGSNADIPIGSFPRSEQR
jgi:hypothetical protein